MSTPREEALRAELQRAAEAHTPDRAAMLNRIAAARARPTPRLRALRLAGSALAVTAVLGVGGFARWALAADHHAPTAGVVHTLPSSPTAPPPSNSPSSDSPLSGSGSGSRSSGSPSSGSSPGSSGSSSEPPSSGAAGAVRGHPGDTKVEKGTLWSDGSVDPMSTAASARSVVTLKASAALTGLDLTIRVAVTPGLTPTGMGSAGSAKGDPGTAGSGTGGDFSTTITRTREAVFFRFVLLRGVTLNAGTYTFTARYAHAAGRRDAGGDTYEAFAADATHRSPHVYGNFYPAS